MVPYHVVITVRVPGHIQRVPGHIILRYHIKLGNLRWVSGVTFVVTSVHFWENDPISGSMHYHCLKLSSTCSPDPEDVSRYFVCCQKMFCGYAEDD